MVMGCNTVQRDATTGNTVGVVGVAGVAGVAVRSGEVVKGELVKGVEMKGEKDWGVDVSRPWVNALNGMIMGLLWRVRFILGYGNGWGKLKMLGVFWPGELDLETLGGVGSRGFVQLFACDRIEVKEFTLCD
jgi:hypothetical protein